MRQRLASVAILSPKWEGDLRNRTDFIDREAPFETITIKTVRFFENVVVSFTGLLHEIS
jgi:hypothetical protein